jgi:nucleoid-associated protein YejK
MAEERTPGTIRLEDVSAEDNVKFDDQDNQFPDSPELPKVRHTPLYGKLTKFYGQIGAVTFSFDQNCGMAILQSAESCAESLDELSKTNPQIRRILEQLTKTGAWGGVIAAHLPIMMTIMMHHGNEQQREFLGRFTGAMAA